MSATLAAPLDTTDAAVATARQLLRTAPDQAEARAAEIVLRAPSHPGALMLLGMARARLGRHGEAASALRRATQAAPESNEAWRLLGDQLILAGDAAGADAAYAQAIRASVHDGALMAAAQALCEGKLALAERALKEHLYKKPTDVAAIRMLAEVAARLGRYGDAEKLLKRALELAPSFTAARHQYAIVLHRESKPQQALAELDRLLEDEPGNPSYRFLRAAALARVGEYETAIALYREILSRYADNPRAWLSLGHALRTAGRSEECIAAYLKAVACAPSFGEAYWSLANMKTHRFNADEAAEMERQLARPDISEEDRFHIHYALGKHHEDAGRFALSFQHYSQGAQLRRAGLAYDAEENAALTREHIALFTADFLNARNGQGSAARDPIFIVGLPRAGSTLIEQILSSHSAVEGTMELPDIAMLAKEIGGGKSRGGAYPAGLADLSPDRLRALGEIYLERTRVQRKTQRPFFIDKMPNNFQHVGFIRLILPNAKIIDARRHPMACCFSAFKQHFARGQRFSYDLVELGRYYADYVALMAHFDAAAPGRIFRVRYEDLVADPEVQTRRLLAYCGLEFEPDCLEFHANKRAVRTASSEQVRQPLYDHALEHWRNFEPWLTQLRTALGSVVDDYESKRGANT